MKNKKRCFNLVLSVTFLLIIFINLASAHVSYVLEENELKTNKGLDNQYLLTALTNPTNIFLIIATIVITLILYFRLNKNKKFLKKLSKIEKKANTYDEYFPLIARLGLAIALIGAGSSNVLISPTLNTTSLLASIQILLGFLLFIGLFITPATIASIILFIIALFTDPYMIGNLDFLGIALTVLILANGKPGIDNLLNIPISKYFNKFKKHIPLICHTTIGFAMMYLAIYEKILNPHISRLVVENYSLTSIIPVSAEMWVLSVGIIEFIVGLLLFIRFKPRLISTITFTVLTITFFYFKESVYSHITLFIILFLIFIIGDRKKLKIKDS